MVSLSQKKSGNPASDSQCERERERERERELEHLKLCNVENSQHWGGVHYSVGEEISVFEKGGKNSLPHGRAALLTHKKNLRFCTWADNFHMTTPNIFLLKRSTFLKFLTAGRQGGKFSAACRPQKMIIEESKYRWCRKLHTETEAGSWDF